LGPPVVDIPAPARNPGKKTPAFTLPELVKAPALEALLQAGYSFSDEASTNCRLDWLDRCPFLPQSLVTGLGAAMATQGMDINEHSQNYFQISRIGGSGSYLLSNSPGFGAGNAVIVAAVVSSSLEVQQIFAFDLSKSKLGTEAADAAASVLITWAAMEGDDLFVSFDSSYRCTDGPRTFGFITRFSMSDRSVKWVSPFSVSDVNFVLQGDEILSANGGSCVDDFVYRLDKETGVVKGRLKTTTAVERMDTSNGTLVLQLYEGAAAYRLP
jgi:outer membrane protein assembly factor BamB